jgi:hypothetical protein
MRKIDNGTIFSPLKNMTHDYEIFMSADEELLNDVTSHWEEQSRIELLHIKESCNNHKELANAIISKNLHDYFWDWDDIINTPNGYQKETLYLTVINSNVRVQGILHAYFPEASKIEAGSNIVYIDRLAVAPWNRQIHGNNKAFSGVGTRLFYAICKYSKENGFNGCIGLHSLPSAEPFYKKLMMKDLGVDASHENLRYFELDGIQAGAI